jgi:glycosyltransferase, group 1 family protein
MSAENRICFFSGDITRNGGTERVAVMIANGLSNRGFSVCFLSLVEQKENPFFDISEAVPRYVLKEDGNWVLPGPGYLPMVPKLRKFLKQQEIKVLIDIDIVLDVLSLPAAAGRETKVISWEHFNVPYEREFLYRRAILHLTARFSDYIVTLTRQDQENYEKLLHRKGRITFIYNPIEPKKFSETKKEKAFQGKERQRIEAIEQNTADQERAEQKEKALITVGRLIERKGIDMLAKIAPRLLKKHKDWKWYVLGDGELRGLLEETVAKYGLEKQLILTGNVTNVEAYLKKSSIYVMTSRIEGLPMCLLEAAGCDLPCVSFDIPTGPAEIIEQGKNGFLISAFDVEKMEKTLDRLMEEDAALNELTEAAAGYRKTLEAKFSKEAILDQWEELLGKL